MKPKLSIIQEILRIFMLLPNLQLTAAAHLGNETDESAFHHSKRKEISSLNLILIVTGVVSSLVLVLFSLYLCCTCKPKKIFSLPSIGFGSFFPRVSYEELFKATNGFSRQNLICGANFGSVYKGKLGQARRTVAVKVLNLNQQGASKSFIAECQALRTIRHRNLVKILTACSSIDFKGNEFKALVYEFMPKGSLERWLYPQERWRHLRNLNFVHRLNISIDVASAIDYLHNQCHTPIIHCDLKPSNVLLDNDMNAHVSDFGIARLISKLSRDNLSQFSSLGLKGTVGYTAPEYGMGRQVSPLGDVYSYGILLLEMFIGKRPTDELFKDEMNIHKYAKKALPDKVLEIVDKSFLYHDLEEEEEEKSIYGFDTSSYSSKKLKECLASVVEVGVACSKESPKERMNMGIVLFRLLSIKSKYLGTDSDG